MLYRPFEMMYSKKLLTVDKEYADKTYNHEYYLPDEYDLKKVFDAKVDSLKSAYPKVDWERLMRED